MGAVSGIMFASRKTFRLSGMILDSPFSDLKEVMIEIAKKKVMIPEFLLSGALSLVKSKIEDVIGADIFDMRLLEKIKSIECPMIFAHASGDTYIPPSHTKSLFEASRVKEKYFVSFEGNHNTSRPKEFLL